MTDADLDLCRSIAEKEEWTDIIKSGSYLAGFEPHDVSSRKTRWDIPRYLTDPAETVRMLEALIRNCGEYDLSIQLMYEGFTISPTDIRCPDFKHAVAEAYLAIEVEDD